MKKNKKVQWIQALAILLPLLAGIGIGIVLGTFIGKNDVQTNEVPTASVIPTQGGQNDEATTLTEPPTPTEAPTLTMAPTPTEAPTLIVAPTPTEVPTPTMAPTPTMVPTPTEVPTLIPTSTPTSIPVSENTAGYYGALHVENTYLADSQNNLVQLRGISTHGLGWFPEYVNEAAIRQFRQEWGCNVIRLAMYTAEYNGYCTSDAAQKENLKKIIDRGVKAATAENMYVIIDWHILQDQDPHTNKNEALKFFDEMSKKYADNPNVLYEICNEPNGGTSWRRIKSYALEVIPVIRKNAPEAVIIVGTPTWSQDVEIAAQDPITEYENIMYALHFYADTHREELRRKCTKAVQMGLPLFVTEYGTCAASGDGYVNEAEANKWMELLDGYGISHVAWNLSNKGESSSMLLAGCKKVNGFKEADLSTGGKWFVNMLQRSGVGIGAALSGTTSAGQEDGNADTSKDTGNAGNDTMPDYAAYGQEILNPGAGLQVFVSNGWSSGDKVGIQLNITVQNLSGAAEEDWERTLIIRDGVTVELDQNWNCVVQIQGNMLTIRSVDYNRTIAAGSSVGDIGIILNVTE